MKHNFKLSQIIILFFFGLFFTCIQPVMAQNADNLGIKTKAKKQKAEKGKPVKYNCFGAAFDLAGPETFYNKMVGGNHVYYRRFGYGLSWRLGIRNMQESINPYNTIAFDTAAKNNWLTGKKNTTYSYSMNVNFVMHITKKIPLYLGLGVTRQKQSVEILPFTTGVVEWTVNPNEVKFIPNFTAGVMIPIYQRLILNLGYDHMPQSVFVGLTICGPYNFEDIDMW